MTFAYLDAKPFDEIQTIEIVAFAVVFITEVYIGEYSRSVE
jgi:hypothetical protein